jgi:hypothetical protein
VGLIEGSAVRPSPADRGSGPRRTEAPDSGIAAAAGTTGGGSGGSSGNGAPLSGLGFVLGSATNPNPLVAWLIASVAGVLFFMILLRRSRDDEDAGRSSMLLAAPAIAADVEVARTPIQPAPTTSKPPAREPAPPAKAKAVPAPKKDAGNAAKRDAKAAKPNSATSPARASGPAPAAKPAPVVKPHIDDSAPLAAAATAAAARAATSASAPRTFDKPPAKGVKRYMTGYRHVRIGDAPDDLRSRELGRLDRGDEVELVDSFEGFLQVRTPDGVVGWIPRQTIVG